MKKTLTWKKKTLSDKSGDWYEANVPNLNWNYVVEESFTKENHYEAFVFEGKTAQEPKKLKSPSKKPTSLTEAKEICQSHLKKTIEKLQVYL
jgi:hypothetical protein